MYCTMVVKQQVTVHCCMGNAPLVRMLRATMFTHFWGKQLVLLMSLQRKGVVQMKCYSLMTKIFQTHITFFFCGTQKAE